MIARHLTKHTGKQAFCTYIHWQDWLGEHATKVVLHYIDRQLRVCRIERFVYLPLFSSYSQYCRYLWHLGSHFEGFVIFHQSPSLGESFRRNSTSDLSIYQPARLSTWFLTLRSRWYTLKIPEKHMSNIYANFMWHICDKIMPFNWL
jgi:hypothetical protein